MTASDSGDTPASRPPRGEGGETSPSPHLTVGRLVDWLAGRLETTAARQVADAVAADDDIGATVTALRRLLAASANLARVQVPEAVHEQLLALWDDRVRPQPTAVSRVVAALRFDSLTARPLAATRGTDSPTDARQLLFTAPGADVVVDLAVTSDGVRLSGQVFSGTDEPQRRAVRLETRRGEVDRQAIDELGEFHFDAVPQELVGIVLEGDDEVVLTLDASAQSWKQA